MNNNKLKFKDRVEISKGIFTLLRDASIFLIFLLLLLAPKSFNSILVNAGFEEGSILNFKWKKQLEENTNQIVEAQKTIDNLTKSLKDSNEKIAQLQKELEIKDDTLAQQIKRNQETVQQANSTRSGLQNALDQNLALLINNYKIQIFYNKNQSGQKTIALEIKDALESTGLRKVEVRTQQDTASSDQIRYFAKNETEVANVLQKILMETYPQRPFRLQTVYTPSPGSVSIFLKS